MNLTHVVGGARPYVDATSLGVLAAAIDGALPSFASLLTVIWMLLRVYEMATVQKHLRRRRIARRRAQVLK